MPLGDLRMASCRAHLAYRPAEGAHRLEIGARCQILAADAARDGRAARGARPPARALVGRIVEIDALDPGAEPASKPGQRLRHGFRHR
jgi:hypothetical protein